MLGGMAAWDAVAQGIPADTFAPRDIYRTTGRYGAEVVRWSWHTLEPLTVCPRLFRFMVVERVAPVGYAPHLALGIAVHSALEFFWRRVRLVDVAYGYSAWRDDEAEVTRVVVAGEAAGRAVLEADTRVEAAERLVAVRTFGGWCDEVAPDQVRRWVPKWIEGNLGVDLREVIPRSQRGKGTIPWEARPDLIVEELACAGTEHPGLWCVDWKTSGRVVPASAFLSYRQGGQVHGNVATCRASGWPVAGMAIDLLGKEAVPKYLTGYVPVGTAQVAEFAQHVRAWQGTYRGMRGAGVWRRVYSACASRGGGRYGLCDYHDPCAEGAVAGVLDGSYPGYARSGDSPPVDDRAVDALWARLGRDS